MTGARLCGTLALWALAVALGQAWLTVYESTPGESGDPPSRWPSDTALPRATDRATLLLFAHPQCPCTRATLVELEGLMTRRRERTSAVVLFWAPTGLPPSWHESPLWRHAQAIPGATVVADADGALATRFDAFTSGFAVLYSADGRLLYHGGITGSRGQQGPNLGRLTIEGLLDAHQPASQGECPVYGCPLRNGLEGPGVVGVTKHD